jgi:hypothetical protein
MKKYSLKSFVCLLMAILMVVGLAACGGDPITPSEDNNAIIPDNTDTVIEAIPLSEIPTPDLPDTDGDVSLDFGGNNKDDSAWS